MPLTHIFRCISQPDSLDIYVLPRTPRYTERLLDILDPKTLWTDYGIDDDIIVGSYLPGLTLMVSCLLTPLQPFTSDFPCANIYKMISPDLLHQTIKGTFKDHLVRWVLEYLVAEHGERQANDILDDIDRRYGILTAGNNHRSNAQTGLPVCRLSLASADFPMAAVSSSGLGTTRRH